MFGFIPETSKCAMVTQTLSGMLAVAAYQRPTHTSPSLFKSLVSCYFLHSLVAHCGLDYTGIQRCPPPLELAVTTIDVDARVSSSKNVSLNCPPLYESICHFLSDPSPAIKTPSQLALFHAPTSHASASPSLWL